MKLGFGSTVLEKGLVQGHMDGIGVYAKNLWEAYGTLEDRYELQKQAFSFGHPVDRKRDHTMLGKVAHISPSYPLQSARAIATGKPFLGSREIEDQIDLFFAPDHHIPKLSHTPVIATIMDAYPLIYPKLVSRRLRRFKNFAFKRASHWADHIVTISEYSKNDISRYFDISEEKITAIPLGVNSTFFTRIPEAERERVRKKYGLQENFFLFVGTIQPRKNISTLIKAYESLPLSIKKKHHLLIVGHYGWGEDKLWERLNKSNTDEYIHHLQKISDEELFALMQSALSMVYPSLYEGFGLPVLEGFASQIPVITSSTTSIPEVAADAALYVDPTISSDIAKKMQILASDTALRSELIEKGVRRAQKYSWEASATQHLDLFRKFC